MTATAARAQRDASSEQEELPEGGGERTGRAEAQILNQRSARARSRVQWWLVAARPLTAT